MLLIMEKMGKLLEKWQTEADCVYFSLLAEALVSEYVAGICELLITMLVNPEVPEGHINQNWKEITIF